MADFGIVARPYARALFELANAARDLPKWSAALHAAAAVVSDPAAKQALARPGLIDAQRTELIRSLCEGARGADVWSTKEGRNALAVLADNDRLAALPEIAAQFDELKAEAENKVKATLISAVEVDRAVADKVAAALQKRLGRTVELEVEVDPTLLGGAIIRAEDMVIDGSVRTRLQRLAETLIS
jgi:F-type H+-transporting ATPase subunit delta